MNREIEATAMLAIALARLSIIILCIHLFPNRTFRKWATVVGAMNPVEGLAFALRNGYAIYEPTAA
jgi:hypothetical protein